MGEHFPGTLVRVTFDFEGVEEQELSVKVDEVLEVVEVREQWVFAKSAARNVSGFVPIGYLVAHEQLPAIVEETPAEGENPFFLFLLSVAVSLISLLFLLLTFLIKPPSCVS